MKNLYPKGKGKIHPSPGSPSGGSAEALAVLKLLPAAILALTAVLGSEDKEVLAYLITRSMNGPASAVTGDELRRCRRLAGGVHHAVLHCGCFDCYTSFWFRWDCSPDRELIHHAIEAFEEHLASLERKIGGGGKGRRRERSRSEKGKKCEETVENATEEEEAAVVEESVAAIDAAGGGGYCVEVKTEEIVRCDDIEEAAPLTDEEEEIELPEEEEEEVIGGERRRGWPDLISILNSRLFNLWSPGS